MTRGAAMESIDDVTIGKFTIGMAQVKMETIGAKEDMMDATIGVTRGDVSMATIDEGLMRGAMIGDGM